MPRIEALTCPNCGATLPARPDAASLVCTYCGRDLVVKQTKHVTIPQPPRPPPLQQLPPGFAGPRIKVSPLLIALPLLLVFAGVGVSVFFAARQQRHVMEDVDRTVESAKHLARTASAERVLWVNYSPAHPARVNGDQVDDLVTFGRFYEGKTSLIYLVAIDGATRQRLWKVGDFGDVSAHSAHTRTFAAVQGAHVVVTDYLRKARILDLATGAEQRVLDLSDRAEWVCADPKTPGKVWIEVADDNHVTLDVDSGELTPARKRPSFCPQWSDRVSCRGLAGDAICLSTRQRRTAEAKGFSPAYTMRDGDHVAAVGTRRPGSQLPMIAGFDATGKKVLFAREVVEGAHPALQERAPEHASLAGGRLFVDYEIGGVGHHLAAFDATTGALLWDVAPPKYSRRGNEPEAIIGSPTRVFVAARGLISIYDAASGQHLGDAGTAW